VICGYPEFDVAAKCSHLWWRALDASVDSIIPQIATRWLACVNRWTLSRHRARDAKAPQEMLVSREGNFRLRRKARALNFARAKYWFAISCRICFSVTSALADRSWRRFRWLRKQHSCGGDVHPRCNDANCRDCISRTHRRRARLAKKILAVRGQGTPHDDTFRFPSVNNRPARNREPTSGSTIEIGEHA
jgi:hypothetical protein